jgi:AAA family ATP:ADP antiporter
MAYYIIKPVREALILQHPDGAFYKSRLGAAIALALLLAVPAYARLADRLPRNRLVVCVTLFFASHLVIFYGLSSVDGARQSLWLSLVFFVWVGIFNMMLVAQLWAFGNDLYSEEQGKRLFVIVGLGASVGAIFGGVVKSALSSLFDVFDMLLVSAVALVGVAGIAQLVHARESRSSPPAGEARADCSDDAAAGNGPAPKPSGADRTGAFAMVLQHRYLLLIALFSLTFTLVNTNGEFLLGSMIQSAAVAFEGDARIAFIAERYNTFFQWVNALGFLLQLFVVSRLVRYAGVSRAFFVLPTIAFLGAGAVVMVPVLAVLFVGKIAENSLDYSLNNTLRQMLWLPTTRDMKYKAKQAVDAFFVRMGDVASLVCVTVVADVLAQSARVFAGVNALIVLVWLWLAVGIAREHRRLVAQRQAAGDGVALVEASSV